MKKKLVLITAVVFTQVAMAQKSTFCQKADSLFHKEQKRLSQIYVDNYESNPSISQQADLQKESLDMILQQILVHCHKARL